MGSLTYTKMIEDIRGNISGLKAPLVTDETIGRAINLAYRRVQTPHVYRHRELEGTINIPLVADQNEYSLAPAAWSGYTVAPSGMARVLTVEGVTHYDSTDLNFKQDEARPLWPISRQELQSFFLYEGLPTAYNYFRDTLTLDAFPDSSLAGEYLNVVCYFQDTALDDSTNTTTAIADDWDDIIVTAATAEMLKKLNRHAESLAWKEDFAQLLRDVVDYAREETARNPMATFNVHVDDPMMR